jgi:predicted ATPase
LRDATIRFGNLTTLIGANASGKSNVLDALRFLAEGVREKGFGEAVRGRGGLISIAWKGDPASTVELTTHFEDGERTFAWHVTIGGADYDVRVLHEWLEIENNDAPPARLLDAQSGVGWWWSNQAKAKDHRVRMELGGSECALAAAISDPEFGGRVVGEFMHRWGFFDPTPAMLRQPTSEIGAESLDRFGRNIAARLYALNKSSPAAFKRIVDSTRSILGLPDDLEPKLSEEGRAYFMQREPGLMFRVHQLSVSSGTLRMLAFMAAMFGDEAAGLVGVEEPENHVHPSALKAFAEHLRDASARVQVVVTTHSPLLLDCFEDPKDIRIVRRTPEGTRVSEEPNPEGVERALEESGFGLGEFYETSGFGG